MKSFLIHLLKFTILTVALIVLLIVIANQKVASKEFHNNETESNLLILKDHQAYDYLILGISHARNLSRYTHHDLFESMIQGKVINLAQGDGLGGLENQIWYFTYFLSKNNTAKNMVLVLSPTLMYSNKIDQNSVAFYREPIQCDFIKHIWQVGGPNKKDQLFHYIKSKLGHNWWTTIPKSQSANIQKLQSIDAIEMKSGMAIAYPQGLDQKVFDERAIILEKIIQLAKTHHITPIIVIPPALFGKWPGHDNVVNYIAKKYSGITFIDSSCDILDPSMYSDHHHLNTEGISKWLEILKPELHNTKYMQTSYPRSPE